MNLLRLHLALAALSVCGLSGCGDGEQRPEVFPVNGTLLVNGEPAEGALLSLHPLDGADFDEHGTRPFANVDADGAFAVQTYGEADGAPVGQYGVSILWFANPDALGPSPDRLGGRYANPHTSGFQITVAERKNELEPFEIDGVRVNSQPRAVRRPNADGTE